MTFCIMKDFCNNLIQIFVISQPVDYSFNCKFSFSSSLTKRIFLFNRLYGKQLLIQIYLTKFTYWKQCNNSHIFFNNLILIAIHKITNQGFLFISISIEEYRSTLFLKGSMCAFLLGNPGHQHNCNQVIHLFQFCYYFRELHSMKFNFKINVWNQFQ